MTESELLNGTSFYSTVNFRLSSAILLQYNKTVKLFGIKEERELSVQYHIVCTDNSTIDAIICDGCNEILFWA
jgi:hypothetical protein